MRHVVQNSGISRLLEGYMGVHDIEAALLWFLKFDNKQTADPKDNNPKVVVPHQWYDRAIDVEPMLDLPGFLIDRFAIFTPEP